jgi:hypothetical protein
MHSAGLLVPRWCSAVGGAAVNADEQAWSWMRRHGVTTRTGVRRAKERDHEEALVEHRRRGHRVPPAFGVPTRSVAFRMGDRVRIEVRGKIVVGEVVTIAQGENVIYTVQVGRIRHSRTPGQMRKESS